MSRKIEIESLESRTFLSAAQVNYPDFTSVGKLATNGYGSEQPISDGELHLTSGQNYQARSVWSTNVVPIEKFRSDFTYQSSATKAGADGFTFTIQNGPTTTLGANGRDLGYGQTSVRSEAIAFDQYNFHQYGSKFGFASNGEKPPTITDLGAIDLHSGHPFHVTVLYNGKTLRAIVTDTTDPTKTFEASENVRLTSLLGTNNAIVGFTAATGANRSYQDILSWTYNGENAPVATQAPTPRSAPTLSNVASASPNPSAGTSTVLTALGADSVDSEKKLTYAWRALSIPAGAKTPTFSKNLTNAAKSTVAHFSKDGVYKFRVTVINTAGLRATSNVTVHVTQVATSIAMTPHKVNLKINQRVTFQATMLDQFNRPMRTQPTFHYAIQSGGGKVNALSGLFIAPAETTHSMVDAEALGITGTVGITIYPKEQRPDVSAGG